MAKIHYGVDIWLLSHQSVQTRNSHISVDLPGYLISKRYYFLMNSINVSLEIWSNKNDTLFGG